MNQHLKIEIDRPISTLRSQLQDGIRELILDGQLKPGERLPERALIEATGVSRPVLREALAHLEARGLVEYVPNSGRVVARVSREKAIEIYEVRAVLESTAAEFFALRASESDMAALRDACDEIRSAFKAGELPKIRAATTAYYDVLLNGCGNAELGTALAPLLDRIAFLRTQSVSLIERREQSLEEMEKLTAVILERNAPAARLASERHVRAAMEAALLRL